MDHQPGWPVPCFCCGKKLHPAIPPDAHKGGDQNQPYAGTAFTSPGHYGSTVFDPCRPGLILELNICDDCLVGNAERVLYGVVHRHETVHYQPWKPPEENEDPDGHH